MLGIFGAAFLESLAIDPPPRVPGTAVFMTGSTATVPPALLHNLKHNKVLHECVMFLTVTSRDVPVVARRERVKVQRLGERPGMATWRDHLFACMNRNTMRATDFFNIPINRVVELGTHVDI
jgi:KUP system potassium uptake protein